MERRLRHLQPEAAADARQGRAELRDVGEGAVRRLLLLHRRVGHHRRPLCVELLLLHAHGVPPELLRRRAQVQPRGLLLPLALAVHLHDRHAPRGGQHRRQARLQRQDVADGHAQADAVHRLRRPLRVLDRHRPHPRDGAGRHHPGLLLVVRRRRAHGRSLCLRRLDPHRPFLQPPGPFTQVRERPPRHHQHRRRHRLPRRHPHHRHPPRHVQRVVGLRGRLPVRRLLRPRHRHVARALQGGAHRL
mmetsp:Transcript_27424/g.89769  ORF Transcript_27424/g.89769 Transcript_27424/m.89769 type:complete len:246 (-) Transcript_27424:1697-2434(-)